MPSGPRDAKGLLLAAIEDPNPVIFLEPKMMYRTLVQEFPKAAYTTPLGVAAVRRPGSDVTLVGWGPSVEPLLAAADAVETEYGIHPEVIDLRTLAPWDVGSIESSVNKTGRLIVSHEAPVTSGFGAEIVATIADRCFYRLESPPMRICGQDTPFPLVYEPLYLPTVPKLVSAIRKVCDS
mmetsp:Transcript_11013/g.31121  ORF Transcript_11013/g.31121 Transcript_11013/m.31121 type:complete len:180 (+) Transcript_11013:901-1440(+)